MSNPVFSGNDLFRKQPRGRVRSAWATPPTDGHAQEGGVPGLIPQVREDDRPVRLDDVIMRTALLLAITVIAAAGAWALIPVQAISGAGLLAALVAFTVALVINLAKPTSAPLIVTYAAIEGIALGAVSHLYDMRYDGLPTQALLATIVTATATLALYKTGWIQVTGKFMRFVAVATLAYAGYALLNLLLVVVAPGASAFGPLYSGGLGLVVGALAVVLAAANLLVDFEAIKRAIERQAPARFAWTAAFGLVVTLAWMYLEILRLLARRR